MELIYSDWTIDYIIITNTDTHTDYSNYFKNNGKWSDKIQPQNCKLCAWKMRCKNKQLQQQQQQKLLHVMMSTSVVLCDAIFPFFSLILHHFSIFKMLSNVFNLVPNNRNIEHGFEISAWTPISVHENAVHEKWCIHSSVIMNRNCKIG